MIAVTGATGHLGQLVIAELIAKGTNPKEIIAIIRNRAKAQNLISKGIEIREADYKSEEALEKALTGVNQLVMISGSEVGQRVQQHTNIVNAAKKAHVKYIAYTSILKADTSKMLLAKEHLATEQLIQATGIPYSFLRNGWYIENYTEQLKGALEHGAIAGSAKNGKISAATRADYAAAAVAAVKKAAPHAIYELGGEAFTMSELAAVVSRVSGKKVEYKDLPSSEYAQMLMGFGVPQGFAEVLADSDIGITRGDLYTESTDLRNLIGRAPASLESAVQAAVTKI
ncbi:MAG: SDR family oxidoreductase [Bdellovibrio sp.]